MEAVCFSETSLFFCRMRGTPAFCWLLKFLTIRLWIWIQYIPSKRRCTSTRILLPASSWLVPILLLDPEDGGSLSLRNVGVPLPKSDGLLLASYLLVLFFDPEDGGSIFLRNVGVRLWVSCRLSFAGYVLDLCFDPEDGGSTFLRNVSDLLPVYTASYLRIQYFRAVVFNLLCSRTPRYNFSSSLYPRSWCIIQVLHSL
jgi:hypothetical protein